MTDGDKASFFHRLIAPMTRRLKYLAELTSREQSVDDLKNEAWILAEEIKAKQGRHIEPEDEELQDAIVAQLFKRFGKFVNRQFRHAVRLDQEERNADGEFTTNSVFARLSAPAWNEPEVAAQQAEEETAKQAAIAARFSEAVAYFHMFDYFDGSSEALASHLAIAATMLQRRVRHAERTAREQPSMFDGIASIPRDFMAKPGARRYKPESNKFKRICGTAPSQLHLFLRYGKVFGPVKGRMRRVI
ncbi:hypothetical protein [Burkholderia plantarii]|uniref:Uncharacterized protein n=1 Tax=Burkholderia plantarii TaxID=41899 RepID=A0A0B6RPQ3_BURPL|nr:hypothetical protein [Burkholderia plantarii]AJK47302.1 hypothetical protein BGL_1c28240 [Burkholderia plantarii]